MIKKILIANRGEIAVRIVRACAEMGIRSVAVYSEADRHALHVKRADEAHSIGADPLAGYLNPRALVNLAVESGCDALHPGYGFLSENAELAEICAERGIKFIGPSAQVIRRMGDKTEARRSMIAAGVPCTPGTEGNVADLAEALREAERIGYPVMLKATSGGGGRGIRRCNSREELEQAFPRVISEATKAFGSAEVFLEKCIVNPKHIEAQILADSFGNTVHLFERDCSIQRRNQKLIEIAPSPQLTPEQRAYIGDLAVRAAKAVGYENAGTVEFLLADGEVYFMEMNTRVQVEHTITEEITGIDVVREQIRIASGLELSVKQDDIVHRGYALQFRINAEDPKNNFLPSFGKITRYYAPGGSGGRRRRLPPASLRQGLQERPQGRPRHPALCRPGDAAGAHRRGRGADRGVSDCRPPILGLAGGTEPKAFLHCPMAGAIHAHTPVRRDCHGINRNHHRRTDRWSRCTLSEAR